MNVNRTIIIPASLVGLARVLASSLSSGGTGMFETPLYSNGGSIITHYISSGWIDEGFDSCLSDANILFQMCNGLVSLAQCTELVSKSIVANCDEESAETTYLSHNLSLGV